MTVSELRAEIESLIGKYGKIAVREMIEQVTSRRVKLDATEPERKRLSELFAQLRYPRDVFNPFMFIQRQAAGRIPVKVSIEVLERIVGVKPERPWALVELIMRKDYPGFGWGKQNA